MAELTTPASASNLAETCLFFAFPGLPRVRCAFTTRRTGCLALRDEKDTEAVTRRAALLRDLGLKAWSELHQVHGDRLLPDPEASPTDQSMANDASRQADGQATSRPGLALAVKTADCQPLLLAHRDGHIAALHVGWRGNALDFPQSGVAAFCASRNIRPQELMAVRGPSLGWAEFVHFEREWPERFRPWFNPETRLVDLWGLTRWQLARAGLAERNIFSLDLCTYSPPRAFFSHRRGDTGRQAALIWMEAQT